MGEATKYGHKGFCVEVEKFWKEMSLAMMCFWKEYLKMRLKKSGKASEEVTIQSHLGCFHDELQSKVTPPQGCMFPLLAGGQTKYSGGQIQFVGLPVYVPHLEGGTGGILGNQTASTKTRSQGRAGMSEEGAEEWAAGCSVSGGAGEKMTVVGWDWGSLGKLP